MSREQLIKAGKVWIVYLDSDEDTILFEGVKTKAFEYVRINYGMGAYKRGFVRVAKVIMEF